MAISHLIYILILFMARNAILYIDKVRKGENENMKKLIKEFRDTFQNYNFLEPNVDVLLHLLDTVLAMMEIVEFDDYPNIKRLSSFIKILSSDFCRDMMDTTMIDNIYETQVLPILVEFDHKYYEADSYDRISEQMKEEAKDKGEYKGKFTGITIEDLPAPKYTRSKNNDTQSCFDALKNTSKKLYDIFIGVVNNSLNKSEDKVLRELKQIDESAKISRCHSNENIKTVASAICTISEFLLNNNDDTVKKRKKDIKESFEFIEAIQL